MDLYAFLVVFALVLLFVVLLPTVSGIGSFSVNKSGRKVTSTSKKEKGKKPFKFELKKDADVERTETGLSTAHKTGKLEIDPRTGLKRRVIGKYDENPNNYDYDLDELVNEDRIEEEKAQAQRLKQFQGSTEKAYEELV
ncbi:Exp1p TDEL_0G02380 [Torulaspora delbrueckii]|uniref:Uncharacterized protein n=1 Tax=Torulaspora delbrueckii TaxID=4950 RepID=G8ZYY0_TORDE|nr:hypothetical protein TDEL_0G02380 [Torulaspora delbrueckii]CCE93605.1 hypothetical protein TDEL_0G02380 [Torulaspora delbrueckii]